MPLLAILGSYIYRPIEENFATYNLLDVYNKLKPIPAEIKETYFQSILHIPSDTCHGTATGDGGIRHHVITNRSTEYVERCGYVRRKNINKFIAFVDFISNEVRVDDDVKRGCT